MNWLKAVSNQPRVSGGKVPKQKTSDPSQTPRYGIITHPSMPVFCETVFRHAMREVEIQKKMPNQV